MLVDVIVRCRVEEGFKLEDRDKNIKMYQWMNYLIKYKGKDIKYVWNDGGEKWVGFYFVDGYDGNINMIY